MRTHSTARGDWNSIGTRIVDGLCWSACPGRATGALASSELRSGYVKCGRRDRIFWLQDVDLRCPRTSGTFSPRLFRINPRCALRSRTQSCQGSIVGFAVRLRWRSRRLSDRRPGCQLGLRPSALLAKSPQTESQSSGTNLGPPALNRGANGRTTAGGVRVGSASGSGAREAAAEPLFTSADLAKKELQS